MRAEVIGRDPAAMPTLPSRPARWIRGWTATSVPVSPLVLFGLLMGPQGLGLLSPTMLSAVDPAIPVALCALGALVGLSTPLRVGVIASAGLHALVTVGAVSAVLAGAWMLIAEPAPATRWLLPLMGGLAAAGSLTLPSRDAASATRHDRFVTAEALLPILGGGVLLIMVRASHPLESLAALGATCGVLTLLACAGWVLLKGESDETESRVFAIAALFLVGGAADYMSSSALFGGAIAGAVWRVLGGATRERLHRDILYVQHPFVVLVLIMAGAHAEIGWASLGLAAAYAAARLAARGGAGVLVSRLWPGASIGRALLLAAPGVFGIALALNAARALGPTVTLLVSVVTLGSVLSDIASRLIVEGNQS